ncbi:MAG: hypothetical protein HC822_05655 [Oscillochloris sp.]|nr:hypothetical protein [Oscillochloris sp.]
MSERGSWRERALRRLRGRGAWRTWLGMALLIALVIFAFVRIIWRELPAMNLAELFSRLSAADIGTAVAVYTLDLALAILGWSLIMGRLSDIKRPLTHARIYCTTAITRRLPGTFWYVLGRVVLYERLGVPRAITAFAGGVEFAVQILGALVVALATWPLLFSTQTLNPLWLAAPLLILGGLLNPPVIRLLLRKLSPNTDISAIRYRDLLLWVGTLALTWAVGGWLLFVVASAITPLPLSSLPGIIGVWATAGAVSILLFSFVPFGLAVNDLTLATMLSAFIPGGEALFIALMMRGLLVLCELAFGALGLIVSLPDLTNPPTPPDPTHSTAAPEPGSLPEAEKPEEVSTSQPILPGKYPQVGGK